MINVKGDFAMENLKQVLLHIADKSNLAWVYLPRDKNWNLDSACAVLASEEVPPELEDEPDAGVPAFATANGLIQVLPVGSMQEIVENAKGQNPNASIDDLFNAFIFYFRNDAFIVF